VAGDATKRDFTRDEVCRLLDLGEEVLERWESHDFVKPQENYSFPDLIALRTLKELRRSRVRPEKLRRILDSLRKKLKDVQNPLQELKVYTDGARVAVKIGAQKMEPISGQLLFDFDQTQIAQLFAFPPKAADEQLARAMAARRRESETWFEKGLDVEQSGGPPEKARDAYLKAVEIDPENASAQVNLGTVLYHLQEFALSEKHYRAAIEARPEYPLAHFNLGNLFDETGDWVHALEHYLIALRLQPEYADAHYNLALLYQSHGEPLKAVRHWRTYIKLDPAGYWAGIACRELGRLKHETLIRGQGS
jgi:tetratricopeptide (TPR) repeat protein